MAGRGGMRIFALIPAYEAAETVGSVGTTAISLVQKLLPLLE